jgi:hypothetical protein
MALSRQARRTSGPLNAIISIPKGGTDESKIQKFTLSYVNLWFQIHLLCSTTLNHIIPSDSNGGTDESKIQQVQIDPYISLNRKRQENGGGWEVGASGPSPEAEEEMRPWRS